MGEVLIYLIPRKYRSIGHFLVGIGGFFIIFFTINSFSYINFLSQSCLIIGLSGIYFSKTKNFRSVRKSEEKEGIEQKYSNGINGKALSPKYVYVFYLITIVGIIIFSMLILQSLNSSIQFSIKYNYDFNLIGFIIWGILLNYFLICYLLLIGGLLILFFKKRKAYWYRLENLPIRYRFTQHWKCKDCGNKFRSKIMQCPKCDGENLKQRG